MYKPIALLSVCVGLLLGLQACKKGENDPFLSMKSRKARITGEWELQSSEFIGSNEDGEFQKYIIEDGMRTDYYSFDTTTYQYSQKITFNKDGSFEEIKTEVNDESESETILTGTWSFLGESETLGMEDKEAVSLSLNSSVRTVTENGTSISTQTYEINEVYTSVLYLDRLSNKEMITQFNEKTTEEGNEGFISYSSTETYKKL